MAYGRDWLPGITLPPSVTSSVTLFDASTILQCVREEYISNPRSGDAKWKGKLIGVAAKSESFEADGSVTIVHRKTSETTKRYAKQLEERFG